MQAYSLQDLLISCVVFACLTFASWRLSNRFALWQPLEKTCASFGFIHVLQAVLIILFVSFVGGVLIGLGFAEASFTLIFSLSVVKALLLVFLIRKHLRVLWTPKRLPFYKEFGFGALLWLFVFPYVGLVSTALRSLYKLFDVSIDAKQSVVMLFERTLHNPIDLWLTATVIVLIVPLIEEIFFRGILQSFLTKRFGAKIGIALTMFVFVVSHFTLQQGWGNIEIFLTLAVLSFFLSYIFHQRGCLWACYGLHATFNAISVMSILLIDGGAG